MYKIVIVFNENKKTNCSIKIGLMKIVKIFIRACLKFVLGEKKDRILVLTNEFLN